MDIKEKTKKQPRETKLIEAIVTFIILIGVMAVGIMHYHVDPHIPMFIGVIAAALMALYIGYDWDTIEKSMMDGIFRALQAIMILAIIGVLVGVWIVSGVVPTMIYYGLQILSPSIFLLAALIICSVTSLATGTSWGTMGTMGLALMGIAVGLGIPAPVTAGAILSGAYFGDKMSPLSDTTNLAPAMAGTDVFTHIKFMLLPTMITYGICMAFFTFLGFSYASSGQSADTSAIKIMSDGLSELFNINPLLLLPPVIVIVAVACKVPAIPGIVLGILAAAAMGPIFQGSESNLGALLNAGMYGFESTTGITAIDDLLTNGGLMNMMFSIALTILAMMFGGIMETTHQLEVIVNQFLKLVKSPRGLVALTEATCVVSNATMPEQYISIVVPGRMYADSYKKMGLHPKTLSNALEGAGTVTSALIPWNTCGVYIFTVLGVSTAQYAPYALFNYLMPLMVLALSFTGHCLADADGVRMTRSAQAKKAAAAAAAKNIA